MNSNSAPNPYNLPENSSSSYGGILTASAILFIAVIVGMIILIQPAKPLTLSFTATDSSTVALANLRGKVVLIDFWATWCLPCRAEVPEVVATYKKYHDQGFEIIGVSLDNDRAKLDNFTKNNGMTWPQYFDGQGWSTVIAVQQGVRSIPAMWLIGKDGKVVTYHARGNLGEQVAKLLAEP